MKQHQLRAVRDTRMKTLAMISDLAQEAIETPVSGGWSVGELLDHLHRSDLLYGREIEKLLQ